MRDGPEPTERMPLSERTRVLLPGLYAWLLTVELPVQSAGVRPLARVTSLVAAGALVAGLFFVGGRLRVARVLGIHLFLAACALTWALVGGELSPLRFDRLRAATGSLGWLLYAFGWGHVRAARPPEDAPNAVLGSPLVPRAHLDRKTLPLAVLAVVAALACQALAFRVERAEHAVFSHAAATACALLLLAVGANVALAQGTRRELASGLARLNAVAVRGAILCVLLGLGLVWAALR